ncbi:hypothetical protein LCGC14_2865550, partial [marine sediment metagenome]
GKVNMAKWTLSIIVGMVILLSVAGVRLYNSDYKLLFSEMPEQDVFILEYDAGNKVEIVTKSSVCPYALFRVTKDVFSAKCGYRKLLDAKWYLEYYKTYGEDEWVRLQRKPSLISLDVSQAENGFIVKKVTPYYATKSRGGTAGNLIETFDVTKDRVKSSLEFVTPYKTRKWRVIWNTIPNIEVIDDQADYLKLEKELNIFFDDALFASRQDNYAYYMEQDGNFKIDPLILFGNLTESGTRGSFKYGFCDSDCNNLGNVSYKESSSAVSSEYLSGWIESPNLRTLDNMTFQCQDAVGSGYCELSVRNGTEIIPTNNSRTLTRCIFNQSFDCSGTEVAIGSGTSFVSGPLNDYDGILVNDSDTLYLGINASLGDGSNFTASGRNYTMNFSRGYVD